jgi:hypothetical protein
VHDPDFTDELATELFRLDAGRLATSGVTKHITRAIVRWADGRAWRVRTEARVEVGAEMSAGQLGFVDVIVARGGGLPDVAIEIDSTDKPWSVVKLQHAVRAGMHAIWVRWGDDEWAGIYDEVDVIQLRLQRRTRTRAPDRQLTMWGS